MNTKCIAKISRNLSCLNCKKLLLYNDGQKKIYTYKGPTKMLFSRKLLRTRPIDIRQIFWENHTISNDMKIAIENVFSKHDSLICVIKRQLRIMSLHKEQLKGNYNCSRSIWNCARVHLDKVIRFVFARKSFLYCSVSNFV